jgi:tetratricopeptide (TPR) repeat protein
MSSAIHTIRRQDLPWYVAISLATLLAMPSQVAGAEDDGSGLAQESASKSVDPEAQRLYEQALNHFKAGELDEAIQKTQAAYLLAPAPELLYNLGQAYRLRGDCGLALDAYRRFLDSHPDGIARERAETRKTEMEKCVDSASPDAGVAVTWTGAAGPVSALDTGTPALEADPGLPKTILLTIVPKTIDPQWVRSQPNLLPKKEATPSRYRRTALVLTITAAVLVATGGYFTWRAHQASDRMSQVFEEGQPWTAPEAENERTGIWSERLAIGSSLLGLAAGGIATWLYWRE